jgi:hypothetical protein
VGFICVIDIDTGKEDREKDRWSASAPGWAASAS